METLTFLVVREYGTRTDDDLRGVVPGDRVRMADTISANGRSYVPLFLVSDRGRRRFLPTFVPMDDLVGILDFASAETLESYEGRLRLQSARAMLSHAVDEIVQCASADEAREALRGEIERWTV